MVYSSLGIIDQIVIIDASYIIGAVSDYKKMYIVVSNYDDDRVVEWNIRLVLEKSISLIANNNIIPHKVIKNYKALSCNWLIYTRSSWTSKETKYLIETLCNIYSG